MEINRETLENAVRNLNIAAMGSGTVYFVVQNGHKYAIGIRTSTQRGHAVDSGVPMTVREAYYAALGMMAGRMQERCELAAAALA